MCNHVQKGAVFQNTLVPLTRNTTRDGLLPTTPRYRLAQTSTSPPLVPEHGTSKNLGEFSRQIIPTPAMDGRSGLGCMTPRDRFKRPSSPEYIAVVHNTIAEAKATRVSGALSVCRYDPLKPHLKHNLVSNTPTCRAYPRHHDLRSSVERCIGRLAVSSP